MPTLQLGLTPRPPFSLGLTGGFQAYFQARAGADGFERGVYSRLLLREGRPLLLRVAQRGGAEGPRLVVRVTGPALDPSDGAFALEMARRLLGTGVDLAPFYRMASGDPLLGPLVERLYGLHPPGLPSVYEALVLAVTGQQVSSTVARAIRRRLVEALGPSLTLGGRRWHSFPTPQRLLEAGPEGLRALYLSRRKADYILGVARLALADHSPLQGLESLPTGEAVARLTRIRGVGRWTAEWVALRALGRLDAFPAGDLALRRMLAPPGEGPLTEEEAREMARRWHPYEGLAVVYLFAARRQAIAGA